jgi:hypothetical protein
MEIREKPRKTRFWKRDGTAPSKKTKEARDKARTCWGVLPYAGRHPYYITNATRNSGMFASALLVQGLDRADHLMKAEGKGAKSALKAVLAYIELIGENRSIKGCIKPFHEALNEMRQAAADGHDVDKTRLGSALRNMRIEANGAQKKVEALQGGLSHRGLL